jgi:hypothetical protein
MSHRSNLRKKVATRGMDFKSWQSGNRPIRLRTNPTFKILCTVGSDFKFQQSAFVAGRVTRDRCYDFLNIFAEKFSEKIGVFDS